MKDNKGNEICNDLNIANSFAKHFATNVCSKSARTMPKIRSNLAKVPPVTKTEVLTSIRALNGGKAPGDDLVMTDFIKNLSNAGIGLLNKQMLALQLAM